MRWTESGEKTVNVNLNNEDVKLSIIFSCKPATEERSSGVGLMLTPAAKRSLIEWKPISDRILLARFKSKVRNISIVHVYAPTNTSPENVKDDFYELLSSTLDNVRKGDILIVMGDLNAKVGSDNTGYESFMGKNGIGTINGNGERFVELCVNKQLVIGGTLFPKKNIHKLTWYSNDGTTRSQLDHFTISRRWRRSLLNVRVHRGADAHTDHRLLVSTIQLKLAAIKQKHQKLTRKADPAKLRNAELKSRYINELKTNLGDSRPSGLKERWEHVRNSFMKSSENTIMRSTERKKCYISDDTWKLIHERKELFKDLNAAERGNQYLERQRIYNEFDKRVKKSARKDRRKWLNSIADDAEEAARRNRIRDTYRIMQKLCDMGNQTEVPIKGKDGQSITNIDSQISRWTEHFQEVLNARNTPQVHSFSSSVSIKPLKKRINTNAPSMTEIKGAIMKMKNWKSPGPDGLPSELFKANSDLSAKELQPIIAEAWNENLFLKDWKEALIIKLPKKGDPSLCNNWRGIVLQNIIGKLLAQIILDRITPALEPNIRQEQAGFRQGRSCTDHVSTLRIIIEQSKEMQSPLYLLFVDFEKAFDSLSRERMWEILNEYGVPTKIINIIRNLYCEANLSVVHQGKVGPEFGVETGVKQGDILSPFLFLLVLDYVMKQVFDKQRGIQWNTFNKLGDLEYADDIVFMTHTLREMREITERLVAFASDVGLKINVAKTKMMVINPPVATRRETSNPLMLNNAAVEIVNKFQYLGSVITTDGGVEEDVKNRIRLANFAFSKMRNLWYSHRVSLRLKLRIFNSNVKSVLLYGCETWKVSNNIMKKLQVFTNRCLRKICGIFYPEIISNENLLNITNQNGIERDIGMRKWKWIGHTLRKASDDIARQAMTWNPPGRRKRGAPATTWQSSVQRQAAPLSWKEVAELAKHRRRWSIFVDALRFLEET